MTKRVDTSDPQCICCGAKVVNSRNYFCGEPCRRRRNELVAQGKEIPFPREFSGSRDPYHVEDRAGKQRPSMGHTFGPELQCEHCGQYFGVHKETGELCKRLIPILEAWEEKKRCEVDSTESMEPVAKTA